MDYTTVQAVKDALHGKLSTDDALLGTYVTACSRAIDRKCTGVPDGDNYFRLDTVTDELLYGQADVFGEQILCYPRKPLVTSVQSFSWRINVTQTEYTVDPSRIEADGPRVTAYPTNLYGEMPNRLRVKISYVGGLSGSAVGLPEDLQNVCTLLAARFYREGETGLSDSIGVAELSQLIYTKAWPVRAMDMIGPFIRRVGWRHVA